jgi:hypothetical protein
LAISADHWGYGTCRWSLDLLLYLSDVFITIDVCVSVFCLYIALASAFAFVHILVLVHSSACANIHIVIVVGSSTHILVFIQVCVSAGTDIIVIVSIDAGAVIRVDII